MKKPLYNQMERYLIIEGNSLHGQILKIDLIIRKLQRDVLNIILTRKKKN